MCPDHNSIYQGHCNAVLIAKPLAFIHPSAVKNSSPSALCFTLPCGSSYKCYWKFLFSFQCRGEKKLARSLLADWDFLPCVTVSVIAMSHFKDFMWVDGWATTRERTVVKIPINEGQRNMTWTASGPYTYQRLSLSIEIVSHQPLVVGQCSVSVLADYTFLSLDSGSCPWAILYLYFLMMNSQL